ncbi:MAG TPA: hypothetical protein VE954_25985 [Oligoflexus sp.]|uniref:hypothetical protein n=1 Tax=Oligoflexus sp. TaxID=1971216 RepID=UPI002D6270D6|nr:hypothetical protein [Oligoflexus sp.]HYX36574.1 hypothetical protein [Oligoflexus sp.]
MDAEAREAPRIVKGVLDLRGWDFDQDGPISLRGEAEFYWERFIDPGLNHPDGEVSPAYIDVSGGWQKSGFSKYGQASYRIRIVSNKPVLLAFDKFWLEQEARLFVNNQLLKESIRNKAGKIAYPFLEPISIASQALANYDIVLHIENHDFYLGG